MARILLTISIVCSIPLFAADLPSEPISPNASLTDIRHVTVGRGSDEGEDFGASIASDGEWLVLGAPWDDVGATYRGGSVYVYRRVQGEWVFEARLDNPDVSANGELGYSVAVEGDLIVAGAPGDGIQGSSKRGAVTVFRYDGIEWSIEDHVTGTSGDLLGQAVAISGGRVYAMNGRSGATFPDKGGPIEIRERLNGNWEPVGEIAWGNSDGTLAVDGETVVIGLPSRGWALAKVFDCSSIPCEEVASFGGADLYSEFGAAVAIDGPTIAVGEPLRNTVHLFRRDGTGAWTTDESIARYEPLKQEFGRSVTLVGERLFAGAPRSETVGVLGTGSVYVFDRDITGWTETGQSSEQLGFHGVGNTLCSTSAGEVYAQVSGAATRAGWSGNVGRVEVLGDLVTLKDPIDPPAPYGSGYDWFGHSLAELDGMLVAGAPRVEQGEISDAGAVYVFGGPGWAERQVLTSPSPSSQGRFGTSVAAVESLLVVGAPESYPNRGRLHVYEYDGSQLALRETLECPAPDLYLLGGSVDVTRTGDQFRIVAGAVDYRGFVCVWEGAPGAWSLTTISEEPPPAGTAFGASVRTLDDVIIVGNPLPFVSQRDVVVYRKISNVWVEDQVISSPFQTADDYGRAVAVARVHGEVWLAIGGPQNREGGFVDLYRDTGSEFVLEQTIKDPYPHGFLGQGVAFDGDRLAVASRHGEQGPYVKLFELDGGTWTEIAEFPGIAGSFGTAIDMSGSHVFVGAHTSYTSGGRESGMVRIIDTSEQSSPRRRAVRRP